MRKYEIKNKENTGGYDTTLLFPVLFLVGFGLVMIYSASSAIAVKRYGTQYYFLFRQTVYAITGGCLFFICCMIPYKIYSKFAYIFLFISIILLLAIQITPFGHKAGGAVRWLRFGSISMQPSEIARFSMIVYLSYSLTKKQKQIEQFSIGFLPHVLVLFVMAAFIMLQPDFGSVAILSFITWIMMFAGGVKLKHLFGSILFFLPVGFYLMIRESYRLERIFTFLNPWKYETNSGYQIIHSLMAFGSGGLTGMGLGQGYQKLFYLPEPHTDFIFSVIGEELGGLVVLGVIFLYALIIWRGIIIARKCNDLFGSLLATGLITAIGLQVVINMAVTLGLLPTKGLTLPFLSYGGTSLVVNMVAVGILMNISKAGSNA